MVVWATLKVGSCLRRRKVGDDKDRVLYVVEFNEDRDAVRLVPRAPRGKDARPIEPGLLHGKGWVYRETVEAHFEQCSDPYLDLLEIIGQSISGDP